MNIVSFAHREKGVGTPSAEKEAVRGYRKKGVSLQKTKETAQASVLSVFFFAFRDKSLFVGGRGRPDGKNGPRPPPRVGVLGPCRRLPKTRTEKGIGRVIVCRHSADAQKEERKKGSKNPPTPKVTGSGSTGNGDDARTCAHTADPTPPETSHAHAAGSSRAERQWRPDCKPMRQATAAQFAGRRDHPRDRGHGRMERPARGNHLRYSRAL